MNRDEEIDVLATSLTLARERRRPLGGKEALIDVSDYTDVARYAAERAKVFDASFNVVCLTSQVAESGAFFTSEIVGKPVLVARGDDGTLRAFLNVCRHRGAKVELRAEGRCKRFVCPYHAWTYNIDGSLHGVRFPEGFPSLKKAEHGLVELPCTEAAGLVFVCPTPGASPDPLPPALVRELESMLGPRPTSYASSTREWNANWKVIVEGGIESYHFRVAHKDTIASYFTDTQSTWTPIGPHMRSVLPKRSVLELEEQPQDTWRIREHTHLVYTIHPNAIVLLQRSHFDLILLDPIAVDRSRIQLHTVGTPPETGPLSDKAQAFFEGNHAFSLRTLDEDFSIGEQIQQGFRSGANTHVRFGLFEDALSAWRAGIDALL
ncbi:MAG: SRPBCC family protein [Myxococcota bacterium]